MADSARSLGFAVLLILLCLELIESRPVLESEMVGNEGTGRSLLGQIPAKIDCGAACNVRCSKSSRPNLCIRACGTCCTRCSCVPPGTSGNYGVCPCYAAMTTRGGARKCP